MKKLFILILTLLSAVNMLAQNVQYLDADGKTQTASSGSYTKFTGQTELSDGWYVVDSDVTVDSRITITGTVHLILTDGHTLTANKGICLSENNELDIYGQSEGTGALEATGGEYESGIGGNNQGSAGKIVINGGKVTAKGMKSAAGIGGGCQGNSIGNYGNGGIVIINGGQVTAKAQDYGAGIGGGGNFGNHPEAIPGDGGTVIINGGQVTAIGGSYGIGPGRSYGGRTEGKAGTLTMDWRNKTDRYDLSSVKATLIFNAEFFDLIKQEAVTTRLLGNVILVPIGFSNIENESAITLLEAIKSNGKQYFNTNYFHKADTRIELDCEVEQDHSSNWEALLGGRLGNFLKNAFCFFCRTDGNDIPCFNRSGNEPRGNGFIYGERILLKCEGTTATWYRYSDLNTEAGSVTTTGTPDDGKTPMFLFNLNTASTEGGLKADTSPSYMTLYGCKIYEDNTLIHDFIPAEYEGEVGLYDRVGKTFRGSGTDTPFEGIEKEDDGGEDDYEKTTYEVNGVKFSMIPVKGGSFVMGKNGESEINGYHNVTLSDYSIGETEVTQELWTAVMGEKKFFYNGSVQMPAESVSWYEAHDFITKLNELTGEEFRLPTEAEWEYAARGGNASKGYLYSGSNTLDEVGWYEENTSGKPLEVKLKSPNELGIYDMSGNVGEMCQDLWGSYSSESQVNPQGPTEGEYGDYIVVRGGNHSREPFYCESLNRDVKMQKSGNYPEIGFRLALGTPVNALKGDVNSDGWVDISDIVATINHIAGTALYDEADVNGDNGVDISDIVAIINIIANGGSGEEPEPIEDDPAVEAGWCPDGKHPHIIDMGAAGKWSCCNVGASAPWEYGGYYAWGETKEKDSYHYSNYTHCDGSNSTMHNIGDDIANTEYDVAHVKWGGQWQMPNKNQIQLLLDNSTREFCTLNGIQGLKIQATNGGIIFLPASGCRWDDTFQGYGIGNYWTSQLYEYSFSGTSVNNFVFGNVNNGFISQENRRYGMSVRPIFK